MQKANRHPKRHAQFVLGRLSAGRFSGQLCDERAPFFLRKTGIAAPIRCLVVLMDSIRSEPCSPEAARSMLAN